MFVKHAGKYAICHNLFLSNAYFTSTITALPSFLPFFPPALLSLFVGECRTKYIDAKPHCHSDDRNRLYCMAGFLSGFGL